MQLVFEWFVKYRLQKWDVTWTALKQTIFAGTNTTNTVTCMLANIILFTDIFGFTIELYVRHLAETAGVEVAGDFYWQNDYQGYLLKWPKLKPKLDKLRQSFIRKLMKNKQSPYDK